MTLVWIAFATGFGLGLALAMPVGPIGLLCLQHALTRGFGAGIAAGLGVALADATYAGIAAFGLTAVTFLLMDIQTPLRTIGLALMLWLAWRIWREADAPKHFARPTRSAAVTTAQLYALTIANPMTILTFMALFVGAGVGLALDVSSSAALTAGAFAGSLAWWIILAAIVAGFRTRLTDAALGWINRVSALMIAGFAAWIATGLVQEW